MPSVKKEGEAMDVDEPQEDEGKGEEGGSHQGGDDEEEDNTGAGDVLEEVATLWAMVKDRPFADAKFTQLALDRYAFSREMTHLKIEKLDAGVERVVLLLREAGHVQPAEVCHRVLVNFKRKMAQALRRDQEGDWLRLPVSRSSDAGKLLIVAVGLIFRLCAIESYGAHFLELVSMVYSCVCPSRLPSVSPVHHVCLLLCIPGFR